MTADTIVPTEEVLPPTTSLYPLCPLPPSREVIEVPRELMSGSSLLFYYPSHKDAAFYALYGFIILFYSVFLILSFFFSLLSGGVYTILALLALIFILLLIPKQIEIWTDSVKIRFYLGYSFNTKLEDIVGVEGLTRCTLFIGLKFITSIANGQRIAIYRRNNCLTSVLITPSNPSQFIAQARYLMVLRAAQLQSYV